MLYTIAIYFNYFKKGSFDYDITNFTERASDANKRLKPPSVAEDKLSSGKAVDRNGKKLLVGNVVEALFNGQSPDYFSGVVKGVNSDGSFRVLFDDDEVDDQVLPQNIRFAFTSEAKRATAAASKSCLSAELSNQKVKKC